MINDIHAELYCPDFDEKSIVGDGIFEISIAGRRKVKKGLITRFLGPSVMVSFCFVVGSVEAVPLLDSAVLPAVSSAQTQVSAAQGSRAESAQTLDRKVDQLERQLRAVQRRVFGASSSASRSNDTGGTNVSTEAPTGVVNTVQSQSLLADLSVQVGAIERQLRELTGRLEELEFEQRNMKASLDLLRKETDLRFREQGGNITAPVGAQSNTIPAKNDVAADPSPQTVVENGGAPVVVLPDGSSAARYDYAFAFIRANDLESGKTAMAQFLEAHSDDERAPNAIFWLGRINLRQEQFGQAAKYFLQLIDEHPGHEKRGDALVDLSEALIELESAPDACDALLEFRRVSGDASVRLKTRAQRLSDRADCRG